MRRFIRYLYEYKQGRRMRNVGFVKVEQDENCTVVHIHGKGLRLREDKVLKLYLFYREGDSCYGIWQANIEHVDPAVNYRLTYTAADTGRPENYAQIDGIIMENDSQQKFAATWDDMLVNVDEMQIWEAKDAQGEMRKEPEEETDAESAEEAEETEEAETEEVTEMAAEEDEASELMPEDTRDEYIVPSRPTYTKIQRQDIARLPRREWRLANNSFLLHGYYNYHHLIFIDEGDSQWLGIPGIYHPREARSAEAFGFPRFIRLDEGDIEWGEKEKNEDEEFGYWCRQVQR